MKNEAGDERDHRRNTKKTGSLIANQGGHSMHSSWIQLEKQKAALLCTVLWPLCSYQWCNNKNVSVMDYAFPTSHITIIDYINNGVCVCVLSHFSHV